MMPLSARRDHPRHRNGGHTISFLCAVLTVLLAVENVFVSSAAIAAESGTRSYYGEGGAFQRETLDSKGWSQLHLAAKNGNLQKANSLLASMGDEWAFGKQDILGRTAYDMAPESIRSQWAAKYQSWSQRVGSAKSPAGNWKVIQNSASAESYTDNRLTELGILQSSIDAIPKHLRPLIFDALNSTAESTCSISMEELLDQRTHRMLKTTTVLVQAFEHGPADSNEISYHVYLFHKENIETWWNGQRTGPFPRSPLTNPVTRGTFEIFNSYDLLPEGFIFPTAPLPCPNRNEFIAAVVNGTSGDEVERQLHGNRECLNVRSPHFGGEIALHFVAARPDRPISVFETLMYSTRIAEYGARDSEGKHLYCIAALAGNVPVIKWIATTMDNGIETRIRSNAMINEPCTVAELGGIHAPPHHIALYKGFPEVSDELLIMSPRWAIIDLTTTDSEGKTAFQVAMDKERLGAALLMIAFSAATGTGALGNLAVTLPKIFSRLFSEEFSVDHSMDFNHAKDVMMNTMGPRELFEILTLNGNIWMYPAMEHRTVLHLMVAAREYSLIDVLIKRADEWRHGRLRLPNQFLGTLNRIDEARNCRYTKTLEAMLYSADKNGWLPLHLAAQDIRPSRLQAPMFNPSNPFAFAAQDAVAWKMTKILHTEMGDTWAFTKLDILGRSAYDIAAPSVRNQWDSMPSTRRGSKGDIHTFSKWKELTLGKNLLGRSGDVNLQNLMTCAGRWDFDLSYNTPVGLYDDSRLTKMGISQASINQLPLHIRPLVWVKLMRSDDAELVDQKINLISKPITVLVEATSNKTAGKYRVAYRVYVFSQASLETYWQDMSYRDKVNPETNSDPSKYARYDILPAAGLGVRDAWRSFWSHVVPIQTGQLPRQ